MNSRPAYDDKERGQIRAALKSYGQQHKVGVPTLQLRIAEAIGDENPDRVPLKSLQRFLAGTHRTDDALVDHCARFLAMVAPPDLDDVAGKALGSFFTSGAVIDETLEGRYLLTVKQEDFAAAPSPRQGDLVGVGTAGVPIRNADKFTPLGVVDLALSEDATYMRAHEQQIDMQRGTVSWSGTSGILVARSAQNYLLILRSYVDSRFCFLQAETDQSGLTGTMIYAASTPIMKLPYDDEVQRFAVQMHRVPEQA